MKKRITYSLSILLSLSGCASIEKSSLLGAAAGGAMGTGIGIATESSVGSALIGLGVGAVVGGVLGFATHKQRERLPGNAIDPTVVKDFEEKAPLVTRPDVRRIWIPGKNEGTRYTEGHFLYLLDGQASFGGK